MKQQRYQSWGLIFTELKTMVKAKDKRIASQVKGLRALDNTNDVLNLPNAERVQQHLESRGISTWIDIFAFAKTAIPGLGRGPEGLIFTVQQPEIDPELLEDEGQWYHINNAWEWKPKELLGW